MPEFDTVIKGGLLIDGQMVPRRLADVALKDGKVAYIGKVRSTDGAEVLDAAGMIVAPGFVDLHTHYDPQFFYDPWCSLSGWHGVTSVVIGNCGFGFAPAKAEHQEYLMRTLNRVESIEYDVMKAVLPWTWETFPEWMDVIDATPKGINALTYVPVNPLLIYVMGYEAAKSRDATLDERREMQRILREAMEAGACGWSAQRTAPGSGFDMQRDYDGSPFATDLMSNETSLALGAVLADFDHAFIQTLVTSNNPQRDLQHIEDLARISDSSIVFNAVATDSRMPTMHLEVLAWIRDCQRRGLKVYPQCLTSGGGYMMTIADGWNLWDEVEAWREATLGTVEEKVAKFRDPARLAAMKAQPPGVFPLDFLIVLRPESERFAAAKGMLLADAARTCGYDDMLDFFFDLVNESALKTLFQAPLLNDDRKLVADMVVEPMSIWGLSDGGAHQKFLTSGSFTTDSIIEWVREKELVTLEEAHHRLSAIPAHCAGFKGNRGRIVEGAPADIIVYDYENLTLLPSEVAYDLPSGDWRRIQQAEGYRYTIVNGTTTFVDGKCTGETPGRLLRHGG